MRNACSKPGLGRRAIPAAVAAIFIAVGGLARADDVKSGPQVGSTVPGRFEAVVLTGPDAGDEHCLFCEYGNDRVVMVFARQPSAELANLVGELEKCTAAREGPDVHICLIVTDRSRDVKKRLGTMADDLNLRHVVLAVADPAAVAAYALSPDAGVTVLLYSNKVIRSNHAFKPGELTAGARDAVVADVKSHLRAK